MENKSKLIGIVLLVLGIACIGLYFVFPTKSNTFKVVFDSNGGTTVPEQIIQKGGKVTKPEDPTKENSTFVEWQLDGVMYIFENTVIKDMTLVAKWNDIVLHNVKVTLDQDEFTANIEEGSMVSIEALNIPTKEGYRIKLFNENNEEFDMTQPVTSDLVLTAQYVEIKTYTVKFDSNGGKKVDSVKVEEGNVATEPTEVTRDGYTLDGWYLGNEKFDFSTPIAKNITLKAKWIENGKINVIFMVDDKVYKTVAVKENTKVTQPAKPTKKGFKFVEWQLDGAAFDFNTKITEETTLTATFEEAKSYTVSFNTDGGKEKIDSQDVEAGAKATEPAKPTKEGYVFVEWQLSGKAYDFNKEVNDDIALKAVWEKEKAKYTVKFFEEVDGERKELTGLKQTVVDGEKATIPTSPKKDGYKFVEWLLNNTSFDFSQPITSDIELTAYFEKEQAATPTAPAAPDTNSVTE